MKMGRRCVIGAAVVAVLFGGATWARAVDNPPTAQGPGEHSTIVTSDGTVRDDELAKMISDAIKASGKTPSSVKVFFNSCYGGGMLDDIANMLANDFDPDIPFVGGAASDADQPAWGPSNRSVGTSDRGSYWTDSLANAINGASQGDSVSGTIGTANANDPAATGGSLRLPAGGEQERTQNTSANGGGNVNWGPGVGVVFSGNNNRKRHDNNVKKMGDAFTNILGTSFTSSDHTTAGLKNAINIGAQLMGNNEEFVLYIDDHGNTEFDFDEWFEEFIGSSIIIDPITGWENLALDGTHSTLHPGWQSGLMMNSLQGDLVEPGINLLADIDEPYWVDSFFDVYFNEIPIPESDIPDVLMPGEQAFIPLNEEIWSSIPPGGGEITLRFVPTTPGATDPLSIINLELTSGPINDLDVDVCPGDANGDGFVNELDAEILNENWGESGKWWFEGDFNDDGIVDVIDASIMAAHWGTTPMESTDVPEPGVCTMLIAGIFGLLGLRRRKR